MTSYSAVYIPTHTDPGDSTVKIVDVIPALHEVEQFLATAQTAGLRVKDDPEAFQRWRDALNRAQSYLEATPEGEDGDNEPDEDEVVMDFHDPEEGLSAYLDNLPSDLR